MADDNDSAEKSLEPSQKKLEDARKKGEIPRSTDLLTAMSYLGMLLIATMSGPNILRNSGETLIPLIEQPEAIIGVFFQDGANAPALQLLRSSVTSVGLVFLAPAVMVLLALFATRGLVFAPNKLVPKLSKISPISNAKNKFGMKGLFEFFKSFAKLTIFSICLALFLSFHMSEIVSVIAQNPADAVLLMTRLIIEFLLVVFIVAIAIGALDVGFQIFEHKRRNRMSQKEMRDEHKEAEGDPMLKQQRRLRAQEMALNQMIADVPKADVVIVNPTHYAVALKWDRNSGAAPKCVAKGTDEIAARIREVAMDAGVPIHSDPPTARALFSTIEIGQEIDHDLYKPVAAAIRFAEAMRKKAKSRGF